MQKVNRYPAVARNDASARHLLLKYIQLKSGFGKIYSVIHEYWLPGERNRDRLLRECRERALNDEQSAQIATRQG